ncbi:hypothetical protein [Rhizomicrobium electricum]|uniref:Uncharacterized protein n=1 Tax=Rhizomicrobium electricum TaxID=480070 RepID=A0ABN1FAS0_9PROT|nr:hypothetical protein [Rhizomicrobium electricum]NIJ50542.1 hypothetical protein [Rhizomicrobium electricum]
MSDQPDQKSNVSDAAPAKKAWHAPVYAPLAGISEQTLNGANAGSDDLEQS